MKHLSFFLLFIFLFTGASAQTFCDQNGNVAIYSNYDGGPLTINVDQNIPNLKIGIVGYEFCRITITGTYAANVTQLWYVGYDGNNDHCSLGAPLYTTITGVPNSVDSILLYPAATYSNPNGYSSIICNYSCITTSNQGGCNTADQIAHYFLTKFGGILRYHFTQYGCWTNTMNVSAGGNCCANPMLGTNEIAAEPAFTISPNPSNGIFTVTMDRAQAAQLEIVNVLGEIVRTVTIPAGTSSTFFSLEGEAAGIYLLRMKSSSGIRTERIVLSE